jgi:hypothetical protein
MSLAQRLMASSAAAAFALVSIVHPALGADNNGAAAKVSGSVTNVAPKAGSEELKTPLMFIAGAETKGKPLLAILVLKGVKDEAINKKTGKPFTGEEIGEILAAKLGRATPPVPRANIKVFVEQEEKIPYSGVAYFLDGHMVVNGILPVDKALIAVGSVAYAYEMEWADLDNPPEKIARQNPPQP